MQKTYSQNVARGFEILCYLVLTPAILSWIYPALFVLAGILQANLSMILAGLLPFSIAVPGFVLLAGYFKHSRGELAEERVPALWIGTAVYNFLLLLPWLYGASSVLYEGVSIPVISMRLFYWLLPISGYTFAIIFALKACAFEMRRKYFYSVKFTAPPRANF